MDFPAHNEFDAMWAESVNRKAQFERQFLDAIGSSADQRLPPRARLEALPESQSIEPYVSL